MKKTTPDLGHCACCHGGKLFCSSSVVHGGNNGWMVKVQARCRAGDGETLPFWESALWGQLKMLGVLADSLEALPTLVMVLLACKEEEKFPKGEWLQREHLLKGSALALKAQVKEWQGWREEKRLFPWLPATAWGNLGLVSDVFLSPAPGIVYFAILSLLHTNIYRPVNLFWWAKFCYLCRPTSRNLICTEQNNRSMELSTAGQHWAQELRTKKPKKCYLQELNLPANPS